VTFAEAKEAEEKENHISLKRKQLLQIFHSIFPSHSRHLYMKSIARLSEV
jgi:hypothetical protein